MHEHSRHNPEQAPDPEMQEALAEHLSEYPLFAAEAPITQAITARVAFLCGDEYPMPEVIVRDSPEPNACMVGNTMVVDSGLLGALDYEEEVYGVLGHELTHLHGDHATRHHKEDTGILEHVGVTRAHEVEADIRSPILLDKRGINPRGVPSAFQKLAPRLPEELPKRYRYENEDFWDDEAKSASSNRPEEVEIQQQPVVDSPTHGKMVERAVNTEQLALLYDLPNLSPLPLTPLNLPAKEQYGPRDTFDQASNPLRRQAALMRSMAAAQSNEVFEEQRENFLAAQTTILQEADPTLEDTNARRLAEVATWRYREKRSGTPTFPNEIPYEASPAGAQQLAADLQHPVLLQTIGAPDVIATQNIASKLLRSLFKSGHSLGDMLAGIDAIDPARSTATLRRALRSAAYKELPGTAPQLLDIFEHTKLAIDDVFQLYVSSFHPHAVKRRLAAAQQYEDDLPFIAYLASIKSPWSRQRLRAEYVFEAYDFPNWIVTTAGSKDALTATTLEEYKLALAQQRQEKTTAYTAEERFTDICTTTEPMQMVAKLAASALPPETKKEIAALWQMGAAQTNWPKAATEMAFALAAFITGDMESFRKSFARCLASVTTFAIEEERVGKNRGKKGQPKSRAKPEVNLDITKQLKASWEAIRTHAAIAELSDEQHAYLENLPVLLGAESDVVNDLQTTAALEVLAYSNDPAPLLEMLAHHTPARLRTGGGFGDEEIHDYAVLCWQRAAQNFLRNPENLTDETGLRTLIALGICAEDVEVNLAVPGGALARLVELHDFETGLGLITNEFAHLPGYMLRPAIEVLIESKATAERDFERLEDLMTDRLEAFIEDNAAEIGVASILDTNIIDAYQTARVWHRETGLKKDVINNMEAVRLLRALLMSGQDDKPLMNYVFERWWAANRTQYEGTDTERLAAFRVEDIVIYRHPHKQARRNWWEAQLPPTGTYQPLTEILDNLYLSNDAAHFVLVRKLMIGNGGVLTDHEGRTALVQAFMESWLQYEEGSAAHRMLHGLLTALMESDTPEHLYQYIGPVFQELMLHPPETTSPPLEIAQAKAAEIVRDLQAQRKIGNALYGTEENAVAQKVLNLIRGSTTPKQISPAEDTLQEFRRLFGATERADFARISPTELALLVGKKSGALGIRMLQLAGQYYDIPDDERGRFNQVYDSLQGQTRLQAMKVLSREAGHSPELRALMDNVAVYGERLGGGSLMTVYGVTMKDGSRNVIGVRNPNAEYHVVRIAELVQRSLAGAIASMGDDTDLLMAQSLLVDGVEWIKAELNDTHFGEKDVVFRREDDTRRGGGFDKGRARYDVIVPEPAPTGTLLVRWEQYVDGVNLNSIRIRDDDAPTNLHEKQMSRSDYQDAVSVLVRNFLHQINNGSYIHPDVHMGNFRITEDNTAIAIFDRYNLIPVTVDLRDTLQQTIRSLATGDRRAAVSRIVQTAASGEQEATPERIAALADVINSRIDAEADLTKAMATTVIELRKAGVRIPLNLSLILRNVFSLAQLAERAGFGNLVMAFLHTASENEIRDVAGDLM